MPGINIKTEQRSPLSKRRVPSPGPPRRHEEAHPLSPNGQTGQHGQFQCVYHSQCAEKVSQESARRHLRT